MKIKIKKLNSGAKIPAFAMEGDAGMDLCSIENAILGPGERISCCTGIAVKIPEEHAGLIWDKSGLALKKGVKIMAGVIDSGYRGEIKVVLINLSQEEYKINKGDKIAQMLIQKIKQPIIEEVKKLDDTSRGGGGFGSTGLE